ncbi:MAG: hypothetical protein AAGA48_10390 [Myxococcota bacterium]
MKAVSLLSVDDPGLLAQIALAVPLDDHTLATPSPTERVVDPGFDQRLPELKRRGLEVLVRQARRTTAQAEASQQDVVDRLATLSDAARTLLERAQRLARDHIALGLHVFDPMTDEPVIEELVRAGLVEPMQPDGSTPRSIGRFALHPDLPKAPALHWDFDDALMPETEDLVGFEAGERATLGTGPVDLLHDVASLAAALHGWRPRRTLSGSITKADGRKLGRRLGSQTIEASGGLEADPRWGRALRALEALGALGLDEVTRELHLDLGLEDVLEGDTPDAVDRLVQRLVDADLRPVLPVVRGALAAAGNQALDEVVLGDLIREQHRDWLFRPWIRQGIALYPVLTDESMAEDGAAREIAVRRFDDDGFEEVEAKMLDAVLRRLHRLGLVRRAPGVVAATDDGRVWARANTTRETAAPPIWISSDLEVVVPPRSVTPWERMQLERLGRCISRDVVDRFRIEKPRVRQWLADHAIEEALDALAERAQGLPVSVRDTLSSWARSAERIVLVRGVLTEDVEGLAVGARRGR